MPTYEYKCMNCGDEFEHIASISADPLEECVKCTGPLFRKIGPGGPIIFKGTGFYETDYKNNAKNKSDK